MKLESWYQKLFDAKYSPGGRELKKLLEQLAAGEHGHYELLPAERGPLTGGFCRFDIDSSQFLGD